ncbi:MAG: sugar fermentation stimulation protein SfsA [Aquificae bacterium]|nr:sugar fermentation stimulation protein SfsA [Aquificota bacterium]
MYRVRLPPLVKAELVRRLNRFVVELKLNGRTVRAHLRNTGRLEQLLRPGLTAYLRPKSTGKYPYELFLVELPPKVLVPSVLANELYRERFLSTSEHAREPTFNGTRLDFLADGTVIEVKSVTLVRGGTALFPDAPTGRAARQLKLMSGLLSSYEATLAFVVLRPDAERFRPHCELDPSFCRALEAFLKAGGCVKAYLTEVSLKRAAIVKEIPVDL